MNEPKAFTFLFENLMLGGGVGFSVRREDVHEMPRVKSGVSITNKDTKDADFIVPDSREGWVKLLGHVLDAFYVTGKSFSYSTILVRPAGERINGFGGTASGPDILKDGIEKIVAIFQSRSDKKLRSIDVLDICNIIGSIVVAGNVRRSALIALGDPDDYLYIRAKNWSLGNVPNWRGMSNNTIYADAFDHISSEIWNNGYETDQKTGSAKGEPYGFFNLPLSQRYGRLKDGPMKDSKLYPTDRDNCVGTNPCVTADTWIMTSDGARQVGQLIDTSFEAIHNGQAYQTVSKGFWCTGRKQIYAVETKRGLRLRLTDNHKLLQDVDGHQQWIELRNLKPGDSIAIQRHTNYLWGVPAETEIGWLLGNLVGDGTFTDDRAILCYWGNSKCEMLAYAADAVKINIGGRRDIGTGVNDDYDRMRLGSADLKNLAEAYGIRQNAKYDLIQVEQTSSSFHEGFLCGLFDADGSVQGNQEKGVSVRLSSVSSPLLRSVQRMLGRLGILSTLYQERAPAQMKSLPDGKGGSKDYPCQALHELIIARDSIGRYANRVGFRDPVKAQLLAYLLAEYRRTPYRDRFADKIVSIEPDGMEDVYDVTVDEAHAFDANGFVAHNCAEVSLSSSECCNLSELYLNNIQSKDELIDCARLLYKTQKAIAAMPFLHKETEEIVHKNMRLGLGVTGVCQSLDKIEWLDDCYVMLRRFDREWSKYRGWPQSIKLTVVKPSGTLSLLAGATPGVHPAYSKHYIRRVRMSSHDKLVSVCRDAGYPVEYQKRFDGTDDLTTVVVEFPCETPTGALFAKDMGVVQQLEMVKRLQTIWADNAVSVTAYYESNELDSLKEWMKANYSDNIKSVSFLLRDNHGFRQAPYQTITEDEYNTMIAKVRPLSEVMGDMSGNTLADLECANGACPVR